MSDDTIEDHEDEFDSEEAVVSQAVASLAEIARELRELAGVIVDINRQPLTPPTAPTLH